MADVATWGEASVYKTLDVVAAMWMMGLGLFLALCEAFGWAQWYVFVGGSTTVCIRVVECLYIMLLSQTVKSL